ILCDDRLDEGAYFHQGTLLHGNGHPYLVFADEGAFVVIEHSSEAVVQDQHHSRSAERGRKGFQNAYAFVTQAEVGIVHAGIKVLLNVGNGPKLAGGDDRTGRQAEKILFFRGQPDHILTVRRLLLRQVKSRLEFLRLGQKSNYDENQQAHWKGLPANLDKFRPYTGN